MNGKGIGKTTITRQGVWGEVGNMNIHMSKGRKQENRRNEWTFLIRGEKAYGGSGVAELFNWGGGYVWRVPEAYTFTALC